MVVISVSIASDQLREFDNIVKEMRYPSRSVAIRDAIYKFVQDHRRFHNISNSTHFLLSLVYTENSKHRVLDILHKYGHMIHSSAHTHFDSMCVDQLVLMGRGTEVSEFVKDLTSIKEVKVCNCIV